jgi:hypothetical protein
MVASSQRVDGVDVAGLAWVAARRRCTRRRLLRSGSPAVSSGASLVRLLASPSSLSSDAPAAARRIVLHRPSSSSSTSPLPLPLRRRGSGKGQNPNVGWWRWTTAPCLPPLAFESPAPQSKAKTQRCPGWVCPGARGGAACFLSTRPRSQGHGAGVKGTFPPPARLDSRAGAPNPSVCVPAGRSGRAPPRASWCVETGGAQGAAR